MISCSHARPIAHRSTTVVTSYIFLLLHCAEYNEKKIAKNFRLWNNKKKLSSYFTAIAGREKDN